MMVFDTLIKNGTCVDGLGNKAFPGTIAVKDGRIAAVISSDAEVAAAEHDSTEVIDASGLIVCPGFIDMHSHADWILPLPDHHAILKPLLEQGITTVIGGNCGYSPAPLAAGSPYIDLVSAESDFLADRPLELGWNTTAAFLESMEKNGIALNLAMLAGHGNLRLSIFGDDYSYPGDDALKPMLQAAEEALEQGAYGISLGLGYAPGIFSEQRELEKFASIAREHDRLLTVHLKAYTKLSGAYPLKLFGDQPHNLKALLEMVELARKTGVKLQISHMLFVGEKTWPMVDQLIEIIDTAVSEGVDIAFDCFPYTCGNTTIYIAYPTWFRDNIEKNFKSKAARLRLRVEIAIITRQLGFDLDDIQILWGGHPEVDPYTGLFFDEIAEKMGCSLFDAYLKVSELSMGKTLGLLHKYNGSADNEATLHKVICHPLSLFETDTILTTRGLQNPSSFGTFPRIIDRYHKELGMMTLEETIAKMTGKSAQRFGITDRGTVTRGSWADLTIFDLNEIRDNTTLRDLEKKPSGIKHVMINGKSVVRNGEAIPGILAGQALRA